MLFRIGFRGLCLFAVGFRFRGLGLFTVGSKFRVLGLGLRASVAVGFRACRVMYGRVGGFRSFIP